MREEIRVGLILLLVAMVPLVVVGYIGLVEVGDIRYLTALTGKEGTQIDFFSYYREMLLGAGGLLLLLTEKTIKNRWKKTGWLLIFLSIISYVTAFSREVALTGMSGRYEGVIAQISYMIIFICGLGIFRSRRNRDVVLVSLFISSTLIFIIGILQYFGYNLYESSLGFNLITGFKAEVFKEVIFRFGENSIYGTHSNPNYMGSYGVMLFYLGLGRYLTSERKYIYGGYTLLAYANLVGSHSRAGKVGLYIGGILLVVVMGREVRKYWRGLLVLGVLMKVVWYGMNTWSDNYLERRTELTTGQMSVVYGITPVKEGVMVEGRNDLLIKKKGEKLFFLDRDGREIKPLRKNGRVYLNKEGYEDYSLQRNGGNSNHYLLNYGEFKYELLWNNGRVYTRDYNGKFTPIEDVERFKMLDGYENKGSKRGYIWSRSIPLLLKRPLTGWGQDNFVLAFPQSDFFGKRLFYGNPGILVDKPHNYFLQIGINNGLLYLGVTLLMLVCYFFKVIIRESAKTIDIYTFVFIGTIAYLVTLLFNDSVVSVAPVFWCLMSMVIANIEGRRA